MNGFKFYSARVMLIVSALFVLLVFTGIARPAAIAAENQSFSVPVSINALMVTLVDHSAHYIWDYGNLDQQFGDEEWQGVEYSAILLAASGPLIAMGGNGLLDAAWADSPAWDEYAQAMSNAAETALNAARIQDIELLISAGNALVDSCEGCHRSFKPELPSEGILHDPQYDHLYHLYERD
jgi:hypothetical protein